ncbi:MAG: Do family serine endopeptidase [Alphaproteobacteria bacterium]|nr:Do family serine endopeptidase [Alphaproteobacteria bacterium]
MKYAPLVLFTLILVFNLPAAAQLGKLLPSSKEEIQLSYAPLVKKIKPAVVNIYTKRVVNARVVNPFFNDPFFAPFFQNQTGGLTRQRVESSLGSGVIVQPDGIVVTNSHVIKAAKEVVVALSDGREFPAEVLLIDEPSDLGLLKINAKAALPYAPLKATDELEVGDLVIAIGNPFGVGQTVTSGIVSAMARSNLNITDYNFFIQTDAAINPGNSGGPLVDMQGNVVGINNAIYSRDGGSLGIGFAIPADMVLSVLAAKTSGAVTASGKIVRPWLGISAQNVTSEIADTLGLSRPQGALIAGLHDASPARKAGIKQGDLITKINDREILDSSEVGFRLATIPVGSNVKMTISRKDGEKEFILTAIAPPEIPKRDQQNLAAETLFKGVSVCNLSPALQAEMGPDLVPDKGVVVCDIAQTSLAGRILKTGDVLVSINQRPVTAARDVEKLGQDAQKAGVYRLTFQRQGREQTITIR